MRGGYVALFTSHYLGEGRRGEIGRRREAKVFTALRPPGNKTVTRCAETCSLIENLPKCQACEQGHSIATSVPHYVQGCVNAAG